MIRLRGMTWDHPRGIDPLLAYASRLRDARRIDLTWDARLLEDFETFPLDELAGAYDLIVIDHPHVGMAAASGCLLPLDGLGRDDSLAELRGNTVGRSHESYHFAGRQWALAIDAAAQVAARRVGAFNFWPDCWTHVMELARTGRLLLPLAPVHALMTFLTLCANIGRNCATQQGEQFADPDGAAIVLARLRELCSLLPPECFSANPIDVLERMCADERFAYAPFVYGYASYARDGFRSTRLDFGNIPGLEERGQLRGSTLGGTGIAVSARSADRDAAVEVAFDLASSAVQRGLYASAGGQPAHRDAWADETVNARAHNFYRNTLSTLELSYIRPRFDRYVAFQSAAGALVAATLRGDTAPEPTVRRLNELFAEASRDL